MILTEEGIAVVEGDSHLSRDIIAHKRLDLPIIWELLDQLKPWIPEGGVVADIGACLGDHTVAYAQMVGPTGRVYAFEPNPAALECLRYNTRNYSNISVSGYALGHEAGQSRIGPDPGQPKNLGMATLHDEIGELLGIHRHSFRGVCASAQFVRELVIARINSRVST